jgi:secondary thiamine-phosphate synthase enzyme
METLEVRTTAHEELVDITGLVQAAVKKSGVKTGYAIVFVPHTTAGVTINENAAPDVARDMLAALERAVPWEGGYRHSEGTAAAHAKASMMGFSQTVFIESGRLVLGTWQAIYFCEFDGPRSRKAHVKAVQG